MRKPLTSSWGIFAVSAIMIVSIAITTFTQLHANSTSPEPPFANPSRIAMMTECPGCGPNLIPNGGYENNSSSILSSNWHLGGANGSRTVRLTSSNNTGDDIDNWLAAPNVYYVKKDGKTNNPQGEYFVWLPNKDQCFNTEPGVIKDMNLCPGRPYTICFKAAAWKNTL